MACINLARLGLVLLACVVVAVVAEDAAPVELEGHDFVKELADEHLASYENEVAPVTKAPGAGRAKAAGPKRAASPAAAHAAASAGVGSAADKADAKAAEQLVESITGPAHELLGEAKGAKKKAAKKHKMLHLGDDSFNYADAKKMSTKTLDSDVKKQEAAYDAYETKQEESTFTHLSASQKKAALKPVTFIEEDEEANPQENQIDVMNAQVTNKWRREAYSLGLASSPKMPKGTMERYSAYGSHPDIEAMDTNQKAIYVEKMSAKVAKAASAVKNAAHAKKEEKKAAPAKKEETKKAASAKKEETKKAAPAKKEETKKAAPAKKEETKKAAPAKKEETKKAAPAKKEETKKAAPAKKEETKKAAPAKKEETKKAAPAKKEETKKAAPAKKEETKKAAPAEKKPVSKIEKKEAKKEAKKDAAAAHEENKAAHYQKGHDAAMAKMNKWKNNPEKAAKAIEDKKAGKRVPKKAAPAKKEEAKKAAPAKKEAAPKVEKTSAPAAPHLKKKGSNNKNASADEQKPGGGVFESLKAPTSAKVAPVNAASGTNGANAVADEQQNGGGVFAEKVAKKVARAAAKAGKH